jgi:hypothetical protein
MYIQGLDKIMKTLHFFINLCCWTTFAFNTAAMPFGMDSYNFRRVCSATLYHSTWRTSSGCSKDAGGGNLFLTLVSKMDQSDSVMTKSSDCVGQGWCWSLLSCSSNHDWTEPAAWIGTLLSWKTALFFGNNVWIIGCTWLPNLFTYSLVVIRPWRVIKGATE